ncbi:ABC transporter permease [Thermofilum sp.]|uniref:ABC transporter permease n=1 Tax=Thermofilum sp. TaxID=1961369 RepID=UPI00386F2E18
MAFASVLGRGILNTIIALALSWWPWYTRLIYIQTTSVKSSAYVDSARIIGLSPIVIMFKHIFPNVITPVATQATLDIGSAILEASALSFLGVGVPPTNTRMGFAHRRRMAVYKQSMVGFVVPWFSYTYSCARL